MSPDNQDDMGIFKADVIILEPIMQYDLHKIRDTLEKPDLIKDLIE